MNTEKIPNFVSVSLSEKWEEKEDLGPLLKLFPRIITNTAPEIFLLLKKSTRS
jgi:hypothetical protein